MDPRINRSLLAAAAADTAAALLHVGCIVFGASWYRFLGAGEGLARLAERGDPRPAQMAAVIAGVLLVWALYALSGAGVIRRMPFVRLVLALIAAVLIARGTLFFALLPYFPGNGLAFWLVTSAICVALGLLHAIGLRQRWQALGPRR
ncbi:MAG: hypothetical protein AMXMBFR59_12020 [Rhodanobacteraceae bacterium]